MPFGESKAERLEWKKWLQTNRDFLVVDCGVPVHVVDDKNQWWHFLGHGYVPECFNIDMLSKEQLQNLKQFVDREYGEDFGVTVGKQIGLILRKQQETRP